MSQNIICDDPYPGGPDTRSAIPSEKMTLEEMSKKTGETAVSTFTGATGSPGGIPEGATPHELHEKAEHELSQLKDSLKGKNLETVMALYKAYEAKSIGGFINATIEKVMICIAYGIFYFQMKHLVRAEDLSFGEWAPKNLGTPMKTVQRYMAIAKIPGVGKYAHLGIERLVHLAGLIKAHKKSAQLSSEDPIADILKQKVELDLDNPHLPIEDFVRGVDALACHRKLENKSINVPVKLVMQFLSVAGEFQSADLAVMTDREARRKEAGSKNKDLPSAEDYINEVIGANGDREGLEKPKTLSDAEKRSAFFLGTTTKMHQAIKAFIEFDETPYGIDAKTVKALIKDLQGFAKRLSS